FGSGGPIVAYNWTIQKPGGTDTRSGPTVQYNWNAPGTYNVSLTVIDSDAQTGSTTTSVNVANAGTGTINVATNLPAASVTLAGPSTYSGSGTSFSIPNAPAGTYTAAFGDVNG